MKGKIKLIIIALLTVLLVSGCAKKDDAVKEEKEDTKTVAENTETTEKNEDKADDEISVVTNIYPSYDWVKEISKDTNVTVKNLTDKGINLHNFEPSAEDITSIKNANLFVYVGGESDEWAPDAIKESPNVTAINMMEVLKDNIKPEEVVEGMEDEDHDHDHDEDEHDEDEDEDEHEHDEDEDEHEHDEDEDEHDDEDDHDEDEHDEHHHHHHDEVEMDEHVWLSLKNAKLVCNEICENLKKLSPKYADKFDENLKAYVEKLDALDKKYSEELSNQKFDTVLFGDRFPFRYLVDDYNLKYYAAFVGCSQESEASFETIVFLANKVDELGLNSIFTLSDSDHKIAETIKENTKTKTQEIRVLNSLESVSSSDNTSYLEIMEENLDTLKAGLN